jgi:hypothetical protein
MQNWIKSGFIFIDDICDPNGFLPTKTIQDRLNIKNNYLNEYKIILESLPKDWRISLKKGTRIKRTINKDSFMWNGAYYTCHDIHKISSKLVYCNLIKNKVTKCYCELYWNSLFEQNINWTTIWTDQTRNLTDNVKLAEFNYKILHLILPSGKLLKRWKLSDTDLCLVCHVIDDYEHMFMSCIRVKNMWQKISYIFKYSFKINVYISFETLILGQQINACNKKFIKFVNIIVTIAKYTFR